MLSPREQFEKNASEFWNVRDDLKGKSMDEIQAAVRSSQLPFAVCALNFTGDLNVGMTMRTAVLLGAERFFLLGNKKYDKRSTVGAHNYIDIKHIEPDGPKYLKFCLRQYGYMPIFVEQGGTNFREFHIDIFRMTYGKNPCFVFGNEGTGIPVDYLRGNKVISIPQRGVLRSLNVAASAAIIIEHYAYELST